MHRPRIKKIVTGVLRLFCSIVILFSVTGNYVFSQNIDTAIKRWKFNYAEYYTMMEHNMQLKYPNQLLCLGTKKDSVKDGMWVYFYPNGKVLAEGRYKMGKKRGTWVYVDLVGNIVNVRWKKKDVVHDKIIFKDYGYPVMIDEVESDSSTYTFENGKRNRMTGIRRMK